MTNGPADLPAVADLLTSAALSAESESQLRDCYTTLQRFAATCAVPAVRAAARAAVAELHAALDGQILESEFYTPRLAQNTPAASDTAAQHPA